MAKINPKDLSLINSTEDVLPLYQGRECSKIGVEVELAFFDPETPGLAPMTAAQNENVKTRLEQKCGAEYVRSEPSSDMLEIASIADTPENLQAVLDDANKKLGLLTKGAEALGLKRSYFQEQPQASADLLQTQVSNVDRYQAFFNPPRADMKAIADYFFVCKSTQVSVSYGDPDEMVRNVRRLYFLAPFLFLLTDNSSAFNEGAPFPGHAGMMHRASLGARGLVPEIIFTAKNGEDYINGHIDQVMNNPLFVYYDENGNLIRLPSGTWTTFNQLREKNLNTTANFFFSETILWPDIKIAALRDDLGNVNGHRFEARMFGVGIHQHQTALLIVEALFSNELFASGVDTLLRDFGFCPHNPSECRPNLEKAYKDARNHGGEFFNIPYGTSSMQDFAQKFATLLERAYTNSPFEAAIRPALSICRSGCTDAKINRILFPDLEIVMDFQKNYDPAIFDDPNNCAHLLFSDDVEKLTGKSCVKSAA